MTASRHASTASRRGNRTVHAVVSEAFALTIAAGADERRRILDSLDEECRSELEQWLRSSAALGDDTSTGFLNRPIVDAIGLSRTQANGEPPLPTTVGAYRILRLIGRGSFARVYLAEQERPVRRTVAVKVLSREIGTADVLSRFDRERHALARLQHPFIATLFEVGVSSGSPYFVMEWIDGSPLTTFVRERKLPLAERLRLFVDLCSAVQHAHERGVLHRDLKPSNILVSDASGEPTVKVIDFGVAKAIADHTQGPLGDSSLDTVAGALVGTPLYMSPELLDGGADEADIRCDVYALGAVLHEVVVERRLLDARPATLTECRRLARIRGPVRLGELSSEIPRRWQRDLDAIIERAAAPDRSHRYRSAGELGDEIDRMLAGDPVRARTTAWTESARRMCRRHPLAVGIIGGCAIGCGALIVALSSRLQSMDLRMRLLKSALTSVSTAESLADWTGVEDERSKLHRVAYVAAQRLVELDADDPLILDLLARSLDGVQHAEWRDAERSDGDERVRHLVEAARLRREHLDVRTRIAARPTATIQERAAVPLAMVLIGNGEEVMGAYDAAGQIYERAMALEEALLVESPQDPLLLSRLSYSCERLSVLAKRRGELELERSICRRRLGLAERLVELLPADRYARLNLAEARRFMLASDDVSGQRIASLSDGDSLSALHVAHCRLLAFDFPGCRRSQRELAMALADGARRIVASDKLHERFDLLDEAASVLRRQLRDEVGNADLVDPLTAIISDQCDAAIGRGDFAEAAAKLDEQRLLLLWLLQRRPTESIYANALAICESRSKQIAWIVDSQ